jgi:hypothetical protein
MEQPLLILLGALLATGGGFISLRYQIRLDQRRRDIELFDQAEQILIEMRPYIDEIMTPPNKELYELSKRLLYIAMRIKTRSYLDLALKLVEFAQMDAKKDMGEVINLIQKVAEISKSALAMYHKKRNEIVKKAWEELKKIGG